ncbi:hypothetical protein LD001_22850, partial [Pseudomonas kurunegalensis]|uniref:hypothetical protein n=1 Tax=Pseudomonas kurunegalensis TaxID=485880 RepID=UPI001CDB7F77
VVEAGHHRQSADLMLAEVRQAYPKAHVGQYLPPLCGSESTTAFPGTPAPTEVVVACKIVILIWLYKHS